MFNDILTGKASNEPKPEPVAPYRMAAELPPVRHACSACRASYTAPAGSQAGRCPTCHVAMVEANTAASAAASRAAAEELHRTRRSNQILRGVLIAAVVIGIGLFKVGMRKQMREDAAIAAGYHSYGEYKSERDAVYPTDEYSERVSDFARSMCACEDLRCTRDVMSKFRNFMRSGGPTDDRAQASVDQDTERLQTCAAKFE